jgi:hypothetical protein
VTQYPVPVEQLFEKTMRELLRRVGVLESRTNALGTSGAGGALTVPSLSVVGSNGSVMVAPDPDLPSPGTDSPAVIISDGQGSSALPPQLYSREITSGTGQPFEELVVRGPQSTADSQQSAALIFMDGGGTVANAALGRLSWEQNVGPAISYNVQWDQWGVTLEQPASGSAAGGGALVSGSALQNDVPPSGGSAPKFARMGVFSGTTDGSGNLAVTGLALGFTPTGVVVTRNGGTGPAGVSCKSASSLSSSGFSTYWDNAGAAYTSAAVAGWFVVFG